MQKTIEKNGDRAALPPPTASPLPQEIRWKRIAVLQALCRILLASFALAVLSFFVADKIGDLAESGASKAVTELLLDGSRSVGATAFCVPRIEKEITVPSSLLTLPRIYYIPKESIVEKSISDSSKLKQKMTELYSYDYSKVPNGKYPIIPTDISAGTYTDIKNDTSYKIDIEKLEKEVILRDREEISKDPIVLIVHTHGTEGFSDIGTPYYNDEFNIPRTIDPSKNTVAVGRVLAEALNKKGIPTLQCEIMHDSESYLSAYERSAESIQKYLKEYPSIKYVFDVHRDSMIQSDLTKLRPVTYSDGKTCAQMMIIVGSGEKSGLDYPWEENLVLAAAIQKNLFDSETNIARQIYLRGATYNQQHSKYGLLLEIGSCGNSLEEAKNAALAFADAFEKVIK